jgi:C-terminal processing protease CtpA/Prc
MPTVVLTNSNTASAAEDFLIYLYNAKNITRVGDNTNGSTGQPLQIELPGNGTAWICTKKVNLPDGEEFIGIGIKPQIVVKQTLNDILYPSRYDTQLSEALNFLQKKKRLGRNMQWWHKDTFKIGFSNQNIKTEQFVTFDYFWRHTKKSI